jgi:hypothetical protein
MKYIITESQYDILMEQPIGLAPVGGYEWQKPKAINKSFDQLKTLSVDDTVDVISAMIDGIPGVGNIVSLGIDVIHALSYFVRLFFADTENEKIEYATLGFLTLATSVIPVGGNSANLVARQGLKSVMRMTPVEIYRVGKGLGLLPDMMILLTKKGWKYKWLLVLAKIFGHELLEVLSKVSVKLNETLKNIKKYKELNFLERPLVYVVDLIEEMKEFVPMVLKLSV